MKNTVKLLSVAFVLGLLLVGCGGASNNEPKQSSLLKSGNDITGFTFGSYNVKDANIDANSVDIAVDYYAAVNANLVPTVTTSPGASYSPSNEAIDFAHLPANYTVTAENLAAKSYDVIVRRAFVVSTASELESAISTVTSDIAALRYITIFVANDINLTAADDITIPANWEGKDIRLESNSTSTVTIRNLTILGAIGLERVKVYGNSNTICETTKTCHVAVDDGAFSFTSFLSNFPDFPSGHDSFISHVLSEKRYTGMSDGTKDNFRNYLRDNQSFTTAIGANENYIWYKSNALLDWDKEVNATAYPYGTALQLESDISSAIRATFNKNAAFAAVVSDVAYRDVYGAVSGEPSLTYVQKTYSKDMSAVFGTISSTSQDTYINIVRHSGFKCNASDNGVVLICLKEIGNARYVWKYKTDNSTNTFEVQKI